MINNTEQIRKMLSFTDENDFYFVQVLKRRKDNPEMTKNQMGLGNYYIESFEQFDTIIPHLIRTAEFENGRVYFHLNKRNYEHLSFHLLKQMVTLIAGRTFKALKNTFDSVTGKNHNDKNRTWVVDIDWIDIEGSVDYDYSGIINYLMELQSETKNTPTMIEIPTKNGQHIITRPFNLKKFNKRFPKIDVHKSSPTILFVP